MSTGLNIPKEGALDFLSLGALIHRLDPGIIPFRKAHECQIHVSGGEFNCAANLSDCFGLKTGVASAMVDYPVGDLIAERVRAMGVKPFYKHFKHNGVNGPNMAAVYSDRGQGVRAPVVFYNRCNEAAAQLKPGDFDWKAIFGGGVRWFHSGGIFAALSPTTSEVIIEAMKAAKAAGVDFVCASSGGTVSGVTVPVKSGYHVPFAREIKHGAGILTRAVGLINSARHAERILQDGDADMIVLARGFLDDPRWGWHAADRLGAAAHGPAQYALARGAGWRKYRDADQQE